MADQPKYKRVLLKISGEGMCRPGGFGIDAQAVSSVVTELAALAAAGVQMGLVIGGGNFIRGHDLAARAKIARSAADYMGMLATVMNAVALRDALEARGIPNNMLSAIPMPQICESFSARQAIGDLEAGKVVILAGGTGSPFFTTDMCAALRAREIGAEKTPH